MITDEKYIKQGIMFCKIYIAEKNNSGKSRNIMRSQTERGHQYVYVEKNTCSDFGNYDITDGNTGIWDGNKCRYGAGDHCIRQ